MVAFSVYLCVVCLCVVCLCVVCLCVVFCCLFVGWLVIGWLVYLVVCLSVYLLRIIHKSVICFNSFIECLVISGTDPKFHTS